MSTPSIDAAGLCALAQNIAVDIGRTLRARRTGVMEIATKSTGTDMVTDMDIWAESAIAERLIDARPHDAMLGEEGTGHAGTSGVQWVVDPIDGTTNFIYGHPGYSVSIAAEVDGEPVAGAIYDPELDQLFAASSGRGATRNGRPISVRAHDDLPTALVATGFAYEPDARRSQAEVLTQLLPLIRDVRRMGGAAIDLASVAHGRVDAYYERGIAHWDVAAGTVIAREAGAVVTGLHDDQPTHGYVIAAAPALHATLRSLLLSIEPPDRAA